MSNLENLRILIVDDEPFMRSTIKAMLRVVGRFIVSDAEDGETALRLLRTAKPELVLCDIGMQPMNGLQFVERLRNHDNHALRDIAVVMLTGHADEATIHIAADLRINGYLVKPISPRLLGDRLQAVFRDRVVVGAAAPDR